MRVKQLSIAKGFKLQTVACRSENKMIFTCTKSGRSYFHKTARPEDKVYCPFMIAYHQHFKSSCQSREPTDYDNGFFYLQKYKSYHNHDIDEHLATSDLWQEVPQTVRAGKFCVVPVEWRILGDVFNYSNKQVS